MTGTVDERLAAVIEECYMRGLDGPEAATFAIAALADSGVVLVGGHGDPGIGRDGDEWRLVLRPSSDAGRVRAPDGLAGRTHDRDGVVNALDSHQGGADDNEAQAGHLIPTFVKVIRSGERDEDGNLPPEVWAERDTAPTVNGFDVGDTRATTLVGGRGVIDDPLLQLGLDSHRYRCCGNGVVSDVSEWIGLRLSSWMDALSEQAA